jgi:hypothetical protein
MMLQVMLHIEMTREEQSHLSEDSERLYLNAGLIMQISQDVEELLKFIIGILHSKNHIKLDNDDYQAIIDGRSATTLGQVFGILKKHVHLDKSVYKAMVKALEYRNYIIHRFFLDHTEALFDNAECLSAIKKLRSMGEVIRTAQNTLWGIFFDVTKVFGLTPDNYWPRVSHLSKEMHDGKTITQALAEIQGPDSKET